ncbi:MAG TPA: PEP-CTERM sorting domain-containing protein [Bryobacteraceae bacterium]|nr:PEP-CTERM sorting domain-containing protein [Bryobacteraceae bacterium]
MIANADNQIFSNPGTILASNPNPNFPSALALANGSVWASGGSLRKLDNNGQTIATFANISVSAGMWTNPVTGHLIAISGGSLLDIDVSGATPVSTIIRSGVSADGVTVSPDGTKAYLGTNGNNIVDLVGAAHALSSFGNVSGIDGMGVIASSNELNGSIIVNTTSGNIVLVNPATLMQTILASGGGYGDFTGADPISGTLLLSSSNAIVRLSCGADCGIGSTPPPSSGVPEPSTAGLLAIVLAGLGALRLRRN